MFPAFCAGASAASPGTVVAALTPSAVVTKDCSLAGPGTGVAAVRPALVTVGCCSTSPTTAVAAVASSALVAESSAVPAAAEAGAL
ncbi:hypothetical protein BDZ88DRAFT_423058 [Geranomyces variabilis]|nr:hypothetical protein BDZ88DRAFT_423058 [Geranomyces variabilis]